MFALFIYKGYWLDSRPLVWHFVVEWNLLFLYESGGGDGSFEGPKLIISVFSHMWSLSEETRHPKPVQTFIL